MESFLKGGDGDSGCMIAGSPVNSSVLVISHRDMRGPLAAVWRSGVRWSKSTVAGETAGGYIVYPQRAR